jgi:sentrin-specific protease 1
MPWKFNGCHALFVIDHVKKHVTFIDFTPTQDWCKHMSYKRFAEAIIQTGVPIDLRGYFLRTTFSAV